MGLSTQHMNVNNPGDCLLRESTSAVEVDKRTVESASKEGVSNFVCLFVCLLFYALSTRTVTSGRW